MEDGGGEDLFEIASYNDDLVKTSCVALEGRTFDVDSLFMSTTTLQRKVTN